MSSQTLRRVGVYGRCVAGDSVLLTRLSRHEPEEGKWTLPGGGMDFGETPHQTLVREFHEETGLIPEVGALLDVHSRVYTANIRRPPLQVVQFVYEVRASGAPEVVETDGSTAEAAWVPLADLDRFHLVDLAAWALHP